MLVGFIIIAINNLLKMLGSTFSINSEWFCFEGEMVVLTEMLGSRFLQLDRGLLLKAEDEAPLPLPKHWKTNY